MRFNTTLPLDFFCFAVPYSLSAGDEESIGKLPELSLGCFAFYLPSLVRCTELSQAKRRIQEDLFSSFLDWFDYSLLSC